VRILNYYADSITYYQDQLSRKSRIGLFLNAQLVLSSTLIFVTTFQLAHLSDTHIGYEAYSTLSASGENQRAVDFARSFVKVCDEIIDRDPALVIHSGDMADRTVIPVRLMLLIRQQVERLAGIRPDGTRRQLVIVAGNHELPRNRREACFLELFRGLPGIQVATRGYEQILFNGTGSSEFCDPALTNTVVHAIPHDALKTTDFDLVRPLDGMINIISSHGVAGGSELYVRSLGREFAIPTDVLARNWEYGALGHWHKQGPVPIAATGAKTRKSLKKSNLDNLTSLSQAHSCGQPDPRAVAGIDYLDVDSEAETGRIWYAGSTENCGFGDLKDNGTRRGWLDVTIRLGEEPIVQRRFVPIRTMFRLPHLDASAMTPDQITEALLENVRSAETTGAIVAQIIDGVGRDIWSLVDTKRVRAAASSALNYEISLRPLARRESTSSTEHRGLTDATEVLNERSVELISDTDQRVRALKLAGEFLNIELERSNKERDVSKVSAKNAVDTDLIQANLPISDDFNAKAFLPLNFSPIGTIADLEG